MTAVLAMLAVGAIAADGQCRTMRVARPAGAVVAEDDSIAGPCPAEAVPAKLRYDVRRGVSVARAELAEGEALGRVYLPPRPALLPGDPVQITLHIGHVVLRREATALQPVHLRQRFFARDAEGHVLCAPQLLGEVRQ